MEAKIAGWWARPVLGPACCALWAGLICYLSGMRGFFAMDQSIVFDGAWRIFQGQVPYRDFLIPFGPMSMWLQAGAFALGGVSYQVYAMTAATMNALGAVLAFATFRILAPEKKWAAWGAGLITGSWLYAPMGTTYLEQTAFLGIWITIFCLVRGLQISSAPHRAIWMAGAGVALAAAVLSKTNAGGLAIPSAFLMVGLVPSRKDRRMVPDAVFLALGIGAGLTLFTLWLWTKSDPEIFCQVVGGAGGQEGRKRLLENKPLVYVFCSLLTGKGNDLIRLLLVAAYLYLGLALAFALGPARGAGLVTDRLRSWSFLGLLWAGYQQAFGVTSNNNGINEQPFLSLILTCVFLVAGELSCLATATQRTAGRVFWGKAWKILLSSLAGMTIFLYALGIHGMGNFNFALGGLLALALLTWSLGLFGKASRVSHGLPWVGAVVGGVVFVIGVWGSYFRQAQDFFNFGTRYVESTGIPKLRGLAWAQGVNSDALLMHPSWEEMVELYHLLETSPGRFHLLGNYTIFYALTGRPNPGPVSYFFRGLTFPGTYDPSFDRDFAARIDHSDMNFFILEDPVDRNGLLKEFPLVRSVLERNYGFVKSIGIFQVYRRSVVEAGR